MKLDDFIGQVGKVNEIMGTIKNDILLSPERKNGMMIVAGQWAYYLCKSATQKQRIWLEQNHFDFWATYRPRF